MSLLFSHSRASVSTRNAGNEFIQLVVFVFGVDTIDVVMDGLNFDVKSCAGGIFDVNGLLAPFTASFAVATVGPKSTANAL